MKITDTLKQIIEKYIQFAIDNGYKLTDIDRFNDCEIDKVTLKFIDDDYLEVCIDFLWVSYYICLEKIITSKPFIEAVASGVYNNWKEIIVNMTLSDEEVIETSIWESFYKRDWLKHISRLENRITTEQSIAIRDNKLEEFINNLLPNE